MIQLTSVNLQAIYIRASDIVAVCHPNPDWKRCPKRCQSIVHLRHPHPDYGTEFLVTESVEVVVERIEELEAQFQCASS